MSSVTNSGSTNEVEFFLMLVAGWVPQKLRCWQRCCLILTFLPPGADSSRKRDVGGEELRCALAFDETQKLCSLLADVSLISQRRVPKGKR